MDPFSNLISAVETAQRQLKRALAAESEASAQAAAGLLRSWSEDFARELAERLNLHHKMWLQSDRHAVSFIGAELIGAATAWERGLLDLVGARAPSVKLVLAQMEEKIDWAAVNEALDQPDPLPGALQAAVMPSTELELQFKEVSVTAASMAVAERVGAPFAWENCAAFCAASVQRFSETLMGQMQIVIRQDELARQAMVESQFRALEEALRTVAARRKAAGRPPEAKVLVSGENANEVLLASTIFGGMSELQQKSHQFMTVISPALEEAAAIADQLALSGVAESLRERRAALLKHRFVVLIFGRFRCGKSTFLNALLGKPIHTIPELPAGAGPLPTDVNPCTARPTRIFYADEPRVRMIPIEGEPQEWTFDQYYHQSRQRATRGANENFFENIDGFELGFPTPFCRDGVDLFDAPGTDDSPDLDLLTLDLADKADAIVFVTSHPAPFGMSEETYLHNLEQSGLPSYLTVINARDEDPARGKFAMPPSEATQSSIWDRIVTRYRKGGLREGKSLATADIFYLNALQAFRGRMNGDTAAVEKSGILDFERRLGAYLCDERHRRHTERHLSAAKAKFADIRREIGVRRAALEANREGLLAELEQMQAKLKVIPKEAENIPLVIQRHREQCVVAIQQSLDDLFDQMATDLPAYMKNHPLPSLLNQGFLNQLAAIGTGLSASRKKVCREAMEIAYKYVLGRIDEWRTAPTQEPGAARILGGCINSMLQDLRDEAISLERRYSDLQRERAGAVAAFKEVEARGMSLAGRIRAAAVSALGQGFEYAVSDDQNNFETPYASVVTDLVRGNPTLFNVPGALPVAFMFDIAWDTICGLGGGSVEAHIKSKTIHALLYGYPALPERNLAAFSGIIGQPRRNSANIAAAVGRKFAKVEETVMKEINDRVQLENNSLQGQRADAQRSAKERADQLEKLQELETSLHLCEACLDKAKMESAS